jgi:hypothetical protein
MMIRIIYPNQKYDMVKDTMLTAMIARDEIAKFYRDDEWVDIHIDPVRGHGGDPYNGPERRRSY